MDVATSPLNGHGSLPLLAVPGNGKQPCSVELAEHLTSRLDWLEEMLHECGGVLFRGFSLKETGAFQQFARSVIPELKPYVEGQSPRSKVADNVYTSTEFPRQYRITLHNELSYKKAPPRRIVFHCQVQPGSGGETPIVDCRRAYEAMDPDLRERFERRGVRYVKNMHGQTHGLGKSWMDHFETNDRAEVESYLGENDIDYEWKSDGSLRTTAVRPGVISHPVTGEKIWFNQSNLWHHTNIDERRRNQILQRYGEDNLPTQAYYGDGTPIPDEDIQRVRNVLWEEAVTFPWRQGDILVLDNYLVAHGRMPYEGPRTILVAMG